MNCYFGGTSAVASESGTDSAVPSRSRHERKESERFKCFPYEELIKRDKINLDILIPSLPFAQSASRPSRLIRRTPTAQLWLKDAVTRVKERPGFPALEESANLPAPAVTQPDSEAGLSNHRRRHRRRSRSRAGAIRNHRRRPKAVSRGGVGWAVSRRK